MNNFSNLFLKNKKTTRNADNNNNNTRYQPKPQMQPGNDVVYF